MAVEEHDRDTQTFEPAQWGVSVAQRCDQHALDSLFLEKLQVTQLAHLLPGAVAQENHATDFVHGVFDAPCDVREEGVGSVDHHEPYRPARTCSELTRRLVANESQLLNRRGDAFAGAG